MAVPVVAQTQTSTTNTAGTSHTVTLPTVVVAGNMLIVTAVFSASVTVTVPSGWTQVNQTTTTFTSIVFVKQSAAGGETTLALTTSGNARMAARAWRITGAHQATTPVASVGANTTSTGPNPPSLSDSTGDHLWLALACVNGSTTTSVYPTSYVNTANIQATTSPTLASASRTSTASTTEDPSAFTISASTAHRAITVGVLAAVPPVAAFTYSQAAGGLAVAFTDGSTYATSYSWAFGDGTTSTSASPSHTYPAAGRYTVTLTATNAYGSTQATATITVIPVPGTPATRPDGITVALEAYMNGAWHALSCDVSNMSWTWGAQANQGLLTQQESGSLSAMIVDPLRTYDPRNLQSSLYGVWDIGTQVRAKVSSSVCFTGRVTDITHGLDRAHGIDFVTIGATDTLGTFGRYGTETTSGVTRSAETTSARITGLADAMAWPAGSRDIGTTGALTLYGATIEDSVWAAMQEAAVQELGRLQVTQAGTLHFRTRSVAWASSATTLTLGCDGQIEVEGLDLSSDASAMVNALAYNYQGSGVGDILASDATSIATYGTWTAAKTDLLLGTTGTDPGNWASFVLNRQKAPMYGVKSVVFQVASAMASTVAGALMGDRWRVRDEHHGPMIDVVQRLLGLSYTVGPSRVVVTATLGEDYGLNGTAQLVEFGGTSSSANAWSYASKYGAVNVDTTGASLSADVVVP